ncbi:alkaline protease 1 [Fusarium pseudocircinatum]|uniref:Alkaline protease 1 n=1 Tax=Fusarium pseudocircinatum TaxID=56676 RepID=A0A8H5UXM2_9HYPO|nr:alkaline protease 1 [Fusarium pseudocircinatum]
MQWATNDAIAKGVAERSVMNLSLSWMYNAMINSAVKKATSAGITVVVSAGNEGKPASTYSPASASSAITVAASGPDNRRAPFSNYGLCVVFAPGICIPTVSSSVDNGLYYSSGTSAAAAAARVSGLAAYFISSENSRGFKAVKTTLHLTVCQEIELQDFKLLN